MLKVNVNIAKFGDVIMDVDVMHFNILEMLLDHIKNVGTGGTM
jgi:hypothetical protein